MDNTKEKQAKLQITIAALVLTVVLFAEMYFMINFHNSYLPIILLAVVALVAVYIVVNAVMTLNTEKEVKRNEHFENLYRSEKASYIMLKKSFDEIEERLNEIQETSKVPAEEIINAQKGIAKVIINRSKENADAIINSNDQVLERLDEVEETQNTKFTSLSKEQRLKLTDMGTQTDMKMQDLLMQLKDTELRLNQAIMSGTKVVMQTPPTYATPVANSFEESAKEPVAESAVVDEMSIDDLMETSDGLLSTEEELETLAQELYETEDFEEESSPFVGDSLIFANDYDIDTVPFPDEELIEEADTIIVPEPIIEEEPVVEPEPAVEEIPPMPDLSDPNKQMSPDDIAALFANMAPVEETVAEPESIIEPEVTVESEPVAEEIPPMPDLSDPNKALNPDEIAALFANMAGGDSPADETAQVEEEIAAVEEEKPPMPDLSDPNKVMSPDEIAALIANL